MAISSAAPHDLSPLDGFHPAVSAWFSEAFPAPTQAQVLAWPAIRSGRHVLVSAPTGSGKTLTAFLAGIDALVRDGLAGRLEDATRIVYVSPLKALSNDIRINLEQPLQGIRRTLAALGLPDVDIRTAVRTGDTPQSERAKMRRKPPHILVTTPESLYILLGSESGRAMLAPARTVIVDEIHAVAASKRGSHLALSVERLEALCGRTLTRIGVSATQKPLDEVARFLVGAGNVVRVGDVGRSAAAANAERQSFAAASIRTSSEPFPSPLVGEGQLCAAKQGAGTASAWVDEPPDGIDGVDADGLAHDRATVEASDRAPPPLPIPLPRRGKGTVSAALADEESLAAASFLETSDAFPSPLVGEGKLCAAKQGEGTASASGNQSPCGNDMTDVDRLTDVGATVESGDRATPPLPIPLPRRGEGDSVPWSGRREGSFATGDWIADCEVVDIGYARQRDLALVLPPTPLSVVMSNEQWEQAYAQVAELAQAHRTTLVFVNTRRMAERAARHLGELLGRERVAAHHGSLAKELRLEAEQRLKRGDLVVLVATSSLELGIDVGDVDLVCQLGSPRAIAAFLQRAGRAGHHVGGVPRARLFPQSRDDLVECAALLDCVRRGELDALRIPGSDPARGLVAPVDVLAQQLVAEVSCREWREDALYDCMRRAWPYRDLTRATFDAVVRMLAEGYATRRGVRSGLVHRDAVNGLLRGRQGGRSTAVMSGGTIPETADYAVVMEPQAITVGSVHEDFAVESLAGDVFQLGNTSYRILRVEPGRLRVEDAQGAAPSIPFWIGEAPGRSDELSIGVARLRDEVVRRLESGAQGLPPTLSIAAEGNAVRGKAAGGASAWTPAADEGAPIPPGPPGASGERAASGAPAERVLAQARPGADQGDAAAPSSTTGAMPHARQAKEARTPQPAPSLPEGAGRAGHAFDFLMGEVGLDAHAASQLVDYLSAAQAALGTLPTRRRIVLERFFDESGGTQLVIHSPFGSRVNRAWGLALRKRFCRKFNFELQAAATEDAIVLSLSTSHSFPLIEVAQYLHSNSAVESLTQALLDAPLFGVRWRWNAMTALALPRYLGGKKVVPQLQRMKSEDLLASVFPDQVACQENIVGEREVPDHPLVAQTLHDCLYDAMDAAGWLELLRGMESGEIEVVARDLAAPSPLSMEAINARPYAFLDDAPLEERRTQAVQSRRYADPAEAGDLGRLDPCAIESVREQAWPAPRTADEMHEALQALGVVTAEEAEANAQWSEWLRKLAKDQRATCVAVPTPCRTDVCRSDARRELLAAERDNPPGRSGSSRELSSGICDGPGTANARDDRTDHGAPRRSGGSRDDSFPLHDPIATDVAPAHCEGLAAEAAPTANQSGMRGDSARIDLWVCAERLAQLRALFPDAVATPPIALPAELEGPSLSREDAALELVRARLGGLGPVDAATLQAALPIPRGELDLALLQLQSEGVAMQGWFTRAASVEAADGAASPAIEWCERHLLARIHRYTLARLRREIEPVEPRDFVRFLCDWQRVSPGTRTSGPEALAGVLAQLEGFEAPAAAWETELLPARVSDYAIAWLDDQCAAGRTLWTRLRASGQGDASTRAPASVRSTPVVLLPRRSAGIWTRLASGGSDPAPVSARAQRVLDHLAAHGASFFDDLVDGTRLLRTELEDALAELVARGRIHCDSFAGLRALLVPASKRPSTRGGGRHRRVALFGIEDAGRWARIQARPPADGASTSSAGVPGLLEVAGHPADAGARRHQGRAPGPERDDVEHVARTLLRRYGVVCWRLLEREAAWLPPWRALVRVLQRLEARGEIRGGRFIAGLSGEQFALPEAIGLLRQVRARPRDGAFTCVSASDPLNLAGTLLPGEKVPRIAGARVLLRDGLAVASLVAGQVRYDPALEAAAHPVAQRLLLGGYATSVATGMNMFSQPAAGSGPVLTG